jgi:hypothetical protein
MNNTNENQGNRLQYWGLKYLIAVMLIIIGYKSPTIWLSISATIWAGYFISIITSPLLIAATQNTSFAKIAKRTLSILGNITTATLISAPIVILHWYWLTYVSNR